jgi:serine/threonine-protein kinase
MRSESQKARLERLLDERRLGDYDILDELGRGGMGVVFKAFHRHLKRMVALKVIIPNHEDEATLLKRFRREAELTARLSHPNIVHVYDYGIINGLQFFAMDFVTGTQLTTLIGSPEFSLRRRVSVLRQIANALEHAHGHGVIHRDIKPDNIIVDAGWNAHLVDFGIAKPTDQDGQENITRQGLAVGTPHYMAPEQFRPKLGEVGPLSDVYSLGAVGYHTLTGRTPFEADTAHGVLIKAATTDAAPLFGLPSVSGERLDQDIHAIITRAMRKASAERYSNSQGFQDDLQRWLDDEPVTARPLSTKERWSRLYKKHHKQIMRFIMTGAAGMSLAIVGITSLLNQGTTIRQHVVGLDDFALESSTAKAQQNAATTALTEVANSAELTAGVIGLLSLALLIACGYLFIWRDIMKTHQGNEATEVLPDEIGNVADEL